MSQKFLCYNFFRMGVFNLKKIYIVLAYTGTYISKIVRIYTKKEYSHVSLSLDKNLEHMYSFGRIFPWTPLIAGFVQESPKYGTFKKFKNTNAKIYSLEVSDQDYEKIQKTLDQFIHHKRKYWFNTIGMVAVMGHRRIKRRRHFYCAEFVKYVLEQTSLQLNLPDIVIPDDFQKIKGLEVVYSGLLRDYDTL